MTLYGTLRAAGVSLDHHASDLYVPVTSTSRPILDRYRQQALRRAYQPTNGRVPHMSYFTDATTGALTCDVFGAYDPFWKR